MAGTSVSVEARTVRSRKQITGEFKRSFKHGRVTLSCHSKRKDLRTL
jgi:hypothetical protein